MLRNALIEDLLSEGHARALLGLSNRIQQEELGKRVVQERLTVREVESLPSPLWPSGFPPARDRAETKKDSDVRHIEEDLQRILGRREW